MFVDGVFMGNSSSRLQDVFDFERVTVLRGPQGALQGRNTTGGAIHIERTRPTGTAGVKIRLQAASYDRQQLNGVFNAPLIKEKLAGKFTVNNIKNGGNYLDNCKLGLDLTYDCQTRDENDRDYLSLTGSLLWTPTTNLSLYYIYENEVDDSNTRGLLNLSAPTDLLCSNSADNANEFCRSTLGIAVPQTLRIDIVDQNFSNESTLDGDYHTLKFDWDSGKHRLTSTAAVRSQDEVLNQDLDATSSDFFSTARQQDYEQRSWELRFQSQASDKLQTVVGSYYINSEYSLLRENPFLLQTLAQEAERARAAEAETTPDVITIPESQYQVTSQKKRSLSFFVHLSYVLSEKWTADIGVRQSRDLVSTTHQPGGTKLEDVIVLPAPIAAQRQYNEVSPQFGLRYRVDENAMLYALYAQSFRSGGFDERAVSADSMLPYSPETVNNYEVGLKTHFWNDRMRINVTGFQSKFKDKQETIFRTVESGNQESVTENIARASVNGFEVDVRIIPMERFQVRAAYGHLSTDFNRFRVPSRETAGAFDSTTGIDLLRAPENTLSLSGSYIWNLAEGRIQANASYSWISDYRTRRSNITIGEDVTDDDTGQTAYVAPVSEPIVVGNVNGRGIWNVSIAYLWQDWTVRLFSRNFNNKQYLQNTASISSAYVVTTGPNDAATPLFTNSEYSEPRYSGLEFTFQPDFSKPRR